MHTPESSDNLSLETTYLKTRQLAEEYTKGNPEWILKDDHQPILLLDRRLRAGGPPVPTPQYVLAVSRQGSLLTIPVDQYRDQNLTSDNLMVWTMQDLEKEERQKWNIKSTQVDAFRRQVHRIIGSRIIKDVLGMAD